MLKYKEAKKAGNEEEAAVLRTMIMGEKFQDNYFRYLGYANIEDTDFLIPSVATTFYSFHLMVILGMFFILVFVLALWFNIKGTIVKHKWFLWTAIFTIPLAYLASELGWAVAEVGRQPWVIQDLMPTTTAVSKISSGSVQITFWLFAIIFTVLLIAEIKIMLRQIKIGPKDIEGGTKS